MENRKKTPKLKEKVKEKEYWDDGRTCSDTDDDKKEEGMKPKETIEEAKLLLKPKRERTQAQIDAFEKAKEKRMEYAELRKKGITEVKETYKKKHYVKKADRVEDPKPVEAVKPVEKLPVETKPKPKAKKVKPEPKSETESEEEPAKVVEKPKKVKKQPRVIFQDATDESDTENEIIIIKKKNKNKVKKEKESEPAPAKEPASNSNAFIIPPVPARKLFFV